jgi:ABC-2 type transport system permease protein
VLVDFAASLSVMFHFESMQRGVLDLRDIIYFVTLMAFALISTGIILKQKRS